MTLAYLAAGQVTNVSDETKDLLIDAKLDLLRNEMRTGFASLQQTLTSHAADDAKAHNQIDQLEERLRQIELETARAQTKMQIIGLLLSLGSGGAGALMSKLF